MIRTFSAYSSADKATFTRDWLRGSACHDEVYATIVSFEEQMRGWLASSAKARTPEQYATVIRRLNEMRLDYEDRAVLLFDDRAAAEFTRLKQLKVRIGTMDLRIASIVLTNAATLISRNLGDYQKIAGLQVEDWTA